MATHYRAQLPAPHGRTRAGARRADTALVEDEQRHGHVVARAPRQRLCDDVLARAARVAPG